MVILNTKPYCNCHARGAWHKQDGYTLDPPSGLWVCSRCRKPSKMNYERTVLGLDIIPQPKRDLDIYKHEMEYESRKFAVQEVDAELDWEEDLENDYYYD
jgi:hypothetical protein